MRANNLRTEYPLSEFADTLPARGDLIVSPWVSGRVDRRDPVNRIVYEVDARYFLPAAHGDDFSYAVLVVKERAGTLAEVEVILKSP